MSRVKIFCNDGKITMKIESVKWSTWKMKNEIEMFAKTLIIFKN